MKKSLFIALLFCCMTMHAQNKIDAISNIEQTASWVIVYNQNGKRAYTKGKGSVGEVVGWSSTFWVSKKGSWYYLWSVDGKKYKSMTANNIGTVISVAGDTFTAKKGRWIYTYDKNGRKIQSRSVNW